jgi:hypothetical protein
VRPAREGDVETVKALLHGGLPVDSGDYDFRTTLHLVGRCRLTVSKPELKARLISALETQI